MFINSGRGRGVEIPFGREVSGFVIDNLELTHRDISTMLDMDEHVLKDNLYRIMCCMEASRHHRSPRRGYERSRRFYREANNPYTEPPENPWYSADKARSTAEQMRLNEEELRLLQANTNFNRELLTGTYPDLVVKDDMDEPEKPLVEGLVWLDE